MTSTQRMWHVQPRWLVLAPWRDLDHWRIVGCFVVFGPLLGGAPYNLLLFPLPFSYLLGIAPAAVAGLLYAGWWRAPGRRQPGLPWRLAMGALCGLAGCAVTAWGVTGELFSDQGLPFRLDFLALHGVPAATLLAASRRLNGLPRSHRLEKVRVQPADVDRLGPTFQ